MHSPSLATNNIRGLGLRLILLLLLPAAALFAVSCTSARATPKPVPGSNPDHASLDLTSLTLTIGNVVLVEGQVSNVGNKALNSVKAVARYYDEKGKLVGEDRAFIAEAAHLAPQQKSGFRIETDPAKAPGVARVGVDFYQGERKLATKHSWYNSSKQG